MTTPAFKRNLSVSVAIGAAILSFALIAPFAGVFGTGTPAPALASTCEFSSLIGENVDAIDRTAFGTRPVRILRPEEGATTEVMPERINLILDLSGVIIEVRCG